MFAVHVSPLSTLLSPEEAGYNFPSKTKKKTTTTAETVNAGLERG